MEKCNSYVPPIYSTGGSTIQDEKWDETIALYNSNQFDKIIPAILNYLDPKLIQYKTDASYSIPHGSVVVNLHQTEKEIKITCPFVDLSGSKKMPLMRKLSELRMHPLNLTNISLVNDQAVFYFECPLSLCEPHKIYNVLHEICLYADIYDDEFIEKFGAKHLQDPNIEPVSDLVKEEAYIKFQHILKEGIQNFDYYRSKRDDNNSWYTLNIILKQLEYYLQPQGFLITEINRAIHSIYDDNVTFQDRLLKGKTALNKLKEYDKDKFFNCLYKVQTFIPRKYSGKKENIRENWSESYEIAQDMINNSRHRDASVFLLSCFYNLFYYNLISAEIGTPISEAMAKASGLSWNEASSVLYSGMEAIMEDNIGFGDFGMDLSKVMGEQMENSMAMVRNMMKGMLNN
ncbi:hypothetical protein [Aquimarina sp. AU58]|uniref:hypothetical protein n=1 Tax=Aquimarina sp. AU58 TaxID=1874112 RepID=UPI000D6E3C01|nr:hypothetical protein [Aquimarina sp. AU58]